MSVFFSCFCSWKKVTGFELHKGESKRWQKSYLWETNQIQIIFLVLNNPRKSIIFQNIHPENQRTFPHSLSVFNTAGNKISQTMEIQVSSCPRLRHLREKDYQIQQSCYTKASALRPYNCLVLLTIGAWHECLRIKRKHLRLIEISYAGMWRQAGETAELKLKPLHCPFTCSFTFSLFCVYHKLQQYTISG